MIDELSKAIGGNGFPLTIAISAGLAVLVAVVLIWSFLPVLRRRFADWRVRRRVAKMGEKMVSNLRIPDGVDGEVHIDHLVLQGERLVVVDVKHYDGLIYGGEALHQWTQVVNRKNFHFENPLRQMQLRIQAVKSVIPQASVDGMVLFAGDGRFPKRMPEGVMTLEDVPRKKSKKVEVSEPMQAVWNRLREYRASGRAR
jgi:hypothetical protein